MEGWVIPDWSKLEVDNKGGDSLLVVKGHRLKDLAEGNLFDVRVGDNAVRFDLCKVVVEDREERMYDGPEESHMGTVEHARATTPDGVEILLRPGNVTIRSISEKTMKEIERSKILDEIRKLKNHEYVLRIRLTKLEAEIAVLSEEK